jgi:hypothetical protein
MERWTTADAYVFGYPLVLSDCVRRAVAPAGYNRFFRLYEDELERSIAYDATVISLFSWIDLEQAPIVLTFPALDSYYCATVFDGWANCVGSAGSRVTGREACTFTLLGPRWTNTSKTPGHRIQASTSFIRVSVRIASYASFPGEWQIGPLGQKPETVSAENIPRVIHIPYSSLVDEVDEMSPAEFFSALSRALTTNAPRPPLDAALREAMPNPNHYNKASCQRYVRLARSRIQSYSANLVTVGQWQAEFRTGSYGRDYVKRAATARVESFGNIAQDYVRLSTGVNAVAEPLDGRFDYRLSFSRSNEPPARGPWFVGSEPLLRPVGSTMCRDERGRIRLSFQQNPPEVVPTGHWLPTHPGRFNVVLHVFWPSEAILDGGWIPPAVEAAP